MKIRAATIIETDHVRHDHKEIEAYMPANYAVVHGPDGNWLVVGVDRAGWTLDDYVIPRLASGLITAKEISPTASAIMALEEARASRKEITWRDKLTTDDIDAMREEAFYDEYTSPVTSMGVVFDWMRSKVSK